MQMKTIIGILLAATLCFSASGATVEAGSQLPQDNKTTEKKMDDFQIIRDEVVDSVRLSLIHI